MKAGPSVHVPRLSDDGRRRLIDLSQAAGIRRVHFLAWRDLDDDHSGGSEVHASTVMALWAQAGIQCTMRTAAAKGRPERGFRDGYSVIRRGSRYSVFPRAALAEATGRHGPADALIEIWNGMPFLSPLWWRGHAHNVWLHHVHGPMWTMMLGRVGSLGVLLEERIAPPLYRKVPIVTLSQSSRRELLDDLGFHSDRVSVVEPGIDPRFTPGGKRSEYPLIVAVGRLAPVKRFHLLVDAVIEARTRLPDLRLVIVGEGAERHQLQERIDAAGAGAAIDLVGHVTDTGLVDLYRRAWAVASASEREGWGMTLTEAAACGTPAIATNIAGHSDAVVDGHSGVLVDRTENLGSVIAEVLADSRRLTALSGGALERAASLTWESTALATFAALAGSVRT